jgi:holliday junction DNA helicase RuvA
MIGQLTGTIVHCTPGRALLEVAGVGYDVRIPLSTFYALSPGAGVRACLHIHTHLRQDALELFGFATRDERTVFERLIGISGVGPRLALAILSGIGVDELRSAVVAEDRARLQGIPGVGKKTADRLLLELRDKMELDPRPAQASAGASAASGPRTDAVSALVNLGYAADAAARAVDAVYAAAGPEASLETVLRAALGRLMR